MITEDVKSAEIISDVSLEPATLQFVPCIRSGSFADIGPRRYMEDEHIRIDDLSTHMGSLFKFPKPSAFYGVNLSNRPIIIATIEFYNSFFFFFFFFFFLPLLMVANAGDCRAVLCCKGEAIDMSQDHRPVYPAEQRRVEQLGGYVDDGYLNGVLSVSRALGDWDMKNPRGAPSPLIAEPEFRQVVLTEDDEFLIIGCDGIWDVMSSQHAVSLVRRGLRRHDDPDQCARDLVMEALRRNTFDNLTVIIVCFSSLDHREPSPPRQRRQRCCSLSAEALCSLRNLLDSSANR
ncbi:protein phosphatase 2c, putative [Ricinus communis]|uniref:Protein phosphatase 2c, putative n=1 Tax=Ricinus communis TaxID=3988 RepID=B9RN78_RICCO|nr:protein phosphatase 2c, putative [Ricinus communis]